MIWRYFPIGMSFPVKDFSDETKRRCWEITLSALATAGAYEEMALYDNCARNLPGSAEMEYVCIMNHRHVKQSRANCDVWKTLSRLNAELSLHYPRYQANALDNFGPYVLLADVLPDGTLQRSETGMPILPERLPDPMRLSEKKNVLIALDAAPTPLGYSETLRAAGRAAAGRDWTVLYCPTSDGGIGTAYALAYAMRGRLEWLKTEDASGAKKQVLLGVLPGFEAVIDCGALLVNGAIAQSSAALGKTICKVLDFGYRKLTLAMADYADTDNGEGLLAVLSDMESGAMDPRMAESEITVLISRQTESCGTVQKLLSLGGKLAYAEDLLFNRLMLAERCRHTGLVIAGGQGAPGFLDAIREACAGHTPLWDVSAQANAGTEVLYKTLEEKFRAY